MNYANIMQIVVEKQKQVATVMAATVRIVAAAQIDPPYSPYGVTLAQSVYWQTASKSVEPFLQDSVS